MRYRYGLVIVFFVVTMVLKGQSKFDINGVNSSIEQKLAQLFVTVDTLSDFGYRYKPGFTICTDHTNDDNEEQLFTVVDVRNGMDDDLRLPFPDTEALRTIKDTVFRDTLLSKTAWYAKLLGYDAMLVTKPHSASQSVMLRTFLYMPVDSSFGIEKLELLPFPENILKQIQHKELEKVQIRANIPQYPSALFDIPGLNHLWLTRERALSTPSLEELLKKRCVFFTNQFKEDHQKLVRLVKDAMLDEALLHAHLNEILRAKQAIGKVEATCEGKTLKDEQKVLRLMAMRKSVVGFEQKSFLPVCRVDSLAFSIWDIRQHKDDSFIEQAHFYHPGIDSMHHTSPKDIVLVLSDAPNQLQDNMKALTATSKGFGVKKILLAIGQEHLKCNENLLKQFEAMIVVPHKGPYNWCLLAQALFGGIPLEGQYVNSDQLEKIGFKRVDSRKVRLGFSFPEYVGMSQDTLMLINDKVRKAIGQKAMPGMQLLVARKGEIVFNQTWGHQKYNEKRDVRTSDLYDLASITKLAVTFPLVMKLYEEGKLDLNQPIGPYVTGANTTDKKEITPFEILTHQSGLRSYLPFHYTAIDTNSFDKPLYSRRYSSQYNIRLDKWLYQNKNARYRKDVFQPAQDSLFSIQVSKNLFMNRHYVDSMYAHILNSELDTAKEYRYSDLGYLLLQKVIESAGQHSLDQLFSEYYARPLGGQKLCFNPLRHFPKDWIAPTEDDLAFRKEQLQGYVHDQGAAMLGGVAAHAGLFSNAEDLAKLAQMLLNGGEYGGTKYLKASTIKKFTATVNDGNRRGIGVDKPEFDPEKSSPSSILASPSSYGHSGFTGTLIWIDPEYELIYIFLSNRVYPRAYNKKLIELNVRTEVQDIVYNSIVK